MPIKLNYIFDFFIISSIWKYIIYIILFVLKFKCSVDLLIFVQYRKRFLITIKKSFHFAEDRTMDIWRKSRERQADRSHKISPFQAPILVCCRPVAINHNRSVFHATTFKSSSNYYFFKKVILCIEIAIFTIQPQYAK